MKSKYYLLLAAFMLMFAGCSDDPVEPDPEKPASIKVDRKELFFSELGGSEVLDVTVENAEKWAALSKISWIEVGEPDLVNGTIEITVAPTEEINDLNGEVILYTDAEDMVYVKVTQEGNGIIHDRSSLKRMNLHGDVKSVSFWFNPVYQWEYLSSYMRDLEFDPNGMLTYFQYSEYAPPAYHVTFKATLSYDDKSRLTRMDVKSNYSVDQAGTIPYEFTIDFEYGNHGKYIETEWMFNWFAERGSYTTHRTWMPKMIKDLEKINVRNTLLEVDSLGIVYKIDKEAGSGIFWTLKDGNRIEQDFMRFEFTGDFTGKVIYPYFFMGLEADFMHAYDVDPESGYILRLHQTSYDNLLGLNIFDKYYRPDLQNSLYRYDDEFDYGYRMDISYNDNLDIVQIDEGYHGFDSKLEYKYDNHGNWTSVTITGMPEPFFAVDNNRTITYWE